MNGTEIRHEWLWLFRPMGRNRGFLNEMNLGPEGQHESGGFLIFPLVCILA